MSKQKTPELIRENGYKVWKPEDYPTKDEIVAATGVKSETKPLPEDVKKLFDGMNIKKMSPKRIDKIVCENYGLDPKADRLEIFELITDTFPELLGN